MKTKIFVIFDVKAEAFMTPFFMNTVGQAERGFSDSIENEDSPFNKHPEDYSLFEIGTFDDSNATIETEAPRCIGTAIEFKARLRNKE